MRVLITGTTGFVGSHCLEAFADLPKVTVIAACRDQSRLIAGWTGLVRVGDLCDLAYIEEVVKDVDVIIHAASRSSLWGDRDQDKTLFLEPSLALLQAALRYGVKRFVFISSLSVAAPEKSADPMSLGAKRDYWPHEANIAVIEDEMRACGSADFCTVSLRLGLFAGSRYGLGLLPVLIPRLKTHLVPWVAKGQTHMAIIDGRDIGACAALAATVPNLSGYEAFNVVGPEVPTVRDVLNYLHTKYGIPRPHFGVSFSIAFAFAWLMEKLTILTPWDPLVTRSIIHLLQETHADNTRAIKKLGYAPKHHWRDAVDTQIAEMGQINE